MFCTFKDPKNVYELFKFISQFETNIILECGEDGMTIFTMSNCHSVFIDVQLPSEYFSAYECQQHTSIGLNLNVLNMVLANCKNASSLNMKKCKDDIIISVESLDYSIRQVNLDKENMEVPELEENCTMTVTPSILMQWKKNVVDFTKSTLCIEPLAQGPLLSSKSDQGMVQMRSFMKYTHYNEPEKITLGNLNINRVFGIGKVSENIEIGYKNDMPLRVQANMGEGTLRVFIAPCIDMEED